jgi:signal transduction histidine kinase
MDAQLAALVVHDLKNALGHLESQLLLVEQQPSRDAASMARRTCEQLRRDLVAFLTLYRGQGLTATVEDESPRALLESLQRNVPQVAAAQPSTAAIQIKLGALKAAPPFWYFDPRLTRLALDAALNNACRYAQSLVTLDAAVVDGELVFSIEDDGPGLQATAPGEWSTGLGTELCRAVARAHRNGGRLGQVHLQDRAEGGARFELRLP